MQAAQEPNSVAVVLPGKPMLQRKQIIWVFFFFFTELFSLYIFHPIVTEHKFSIFSYTTTSALKMPEKWIFTFVFSFAWLALKEKATEEQ